MQLEWELDSLTFHLLRVISKHKVSLQQATLFPPQYDVN